MDMILGNVNFKIVFFLIFSNICCRYTLELPHRGNSNVRQFQCVPTTHVFLINDVFVISFFLTHSQPLSFIQRNEHGATSRVVCHAPG